MEHHCKPSEQAQRWTQLGHRLGNNSALSAASTPFRSFSRSLSRSPAAAQRQRPAVATLRQCVQKPVRAGVSPPPSGKKCQQARASGFFWRQQPGATGGLRPAAPSICLSQRATHFPILNKPALSR